MYDVWVPGEERNIQEKLGGGGCWVPQECDWLVGSLNWRSPEYEPCRSPCKRVTHSTHVDTPPCFLSPSMATADWTAEST